MSTSQAAALPARYAKFITAVLGEAVAYIQLYGPVWHLEPALVMAGAALAVLGVPNAPAPSAAADAGRQVVQAMKAAPSGAVTVVPPADRPTGGI